MELKDKAKRVFFLALTMDGIQTVMRKEIEKRMAILCYDKTILRTHADNALSHWFK